jgi:hypothetical protein
MRGQFEIFAQFVMLTCLAFMHWIFGFEVAVYGGLSAIFAKLYIVERELKI